jgi:hypothetical protein
MNNFVANIYQPDKDIFGEPQQYKGVKFYPIKIKQTKLKKLLYKLFFQPKNYIPQREILKMSYFKFLVYVIQGNLEENITNDLIEFISIITKVDKEKISIKTTEHPENIELFDKIMLHLYVDGIEFNELEFDNLREILIEQNGSSIEWVESFDKTLEQKMDFINRGNINIDLKDEIFSFCAITKISEIEAGEKTLYQFKNRLEREMMMKDYDNFKVAELTGEVKSKSGAEIFKHYLSHIPKTNRYDTILINENTFLEQSGFNKPNES